MRKSLCCTRVRFCVNIKFHHYRTVLKWFCREGAIKMAQQAIKHRVKVITRLYYTIVRLNLWLRSTSRCGKCWLGVNTIHTLKSIMSLNLTHREFWMLALRIDRLREDVQCCVIIANKQRKTVSTITTPHRNISKFGNADRKKNIHFMCRIPPLQDNACWCNRSTLKALQSILRRFGSPEADYSANL